MSMQSVLLKEKAWRMRIRYEARRAGGDTC